MNAILSIKSKVIEEIAENLGIKVYYNRDTVPHVKNLIRWGSTKTCDFDICWNPTSAIRKSSNKALCRQILAEAGVPVPLSGTDRFPCIGRPEKHTRGRKFIVCRNQADVQRAKRLGCRYFSQFYPKKNEYRVHIGSGKIIFISRKEGGNHPFVWNHAKGYIFTPLRRSEYRPEVYHIAKDAIKALGLDFGAVDIMSDAPGFSIAVVSEVNTAPSLSPYGIGKYTEYFERILTNPR